MQRHAIALALAAGLLVAAGATHASRDIDKVNGSIQAEAGQVYGDLSTVNGGIRIADGVRLEDAETVNGSIRAGNDIQARDLETVNGSIRIGTGARIGGSLETVNGDVFVDRDGIVEGHVRTVNGAIGLVATVLRGGIETANGNITVGIRSHVHGGIRVTRPSSNWLPVSVNRRKPRVVIGPGAVVDGPLVFEREVSLYVHDSARIGTVTGATPVAFDTASAPRD